MRIRPAHMRLILLLSILVLPMTAAAQGELTVDASTQVRCDKVEFTIEIAGGNRPYRARVDFGDGELVESAHLGGTALYLDHVYPAQGVYKWTITIEDGNGSTAVVEGSVSLEGPAVTLGSDPFPPLLTIEADEAAITFIARASGGTTPYAIVWDLDGASDPGLEGTSATTTYTAGGEYHAVVTVTDACGFTASDTLKVIVVDPERDPEGACHPTAQKIAEAVSAIFPKRAEQTYTCKDVFDLFEGAVFGYQVGFGRMWHAYQLTQRIADLTWEEILDWQLNYSGWGVLTQLDRFADLLETRGIGDLVGLITSEEHTLAEIRSAVRAVMRYEADFDDARLRINAGATPGEIGQFYRLAADLEIDPAVLDGYLADGMTLHELSQAAKLAGRVGAEWEAIIEAKSHHHSWGEIRQAYRLADESHSAADILGKGVREPHELAREADRNERDQEQMERTAQRLAGQYETQLGDVMSLFEGECDSSWGCVRKMLREGTHPQDASSSRDNRTAARIASQYGITENQVWRVFETSCAGDWICVRTHFRDLAKEARGNGKEK